MENDKVIKVSDWSQKYKLVIYAVSGLGIMYIGINLLAKLDRMIELLEVLAK